MGLLRYLLALSVLAFHSSPIFGCEWMGGEMAVKAFFILSGFYMALVLNEKYIGTQGGYGLFLTNRIMRLYPLYLTVLLLTLLYVGVTGTPGRAFAWADHSQVLGWGPKVGLAGLNLSLIGQDWVYFFGINGNGELQFTSDFSQTHPPLHLFLLVPQAWSIALELYFYALAPFILRRGAKWVGFATLGAGAMSWGIFQAGGQWDPWTYRFFPAILVYFLLGSLSYFLWKKVERWHHPRGWDFLFWLALLGATFFYYRFPGRILFPEIYFAFLVLSIPFIFRLTKNWRWDRWVGELSYPLYISHLLVNLWVRGDKVPIWESRGTTLAIWGTLVAILLYYAIARPMDRWREKRWREKVSLANSRDKPNLEK